MALSPWFSLIFVDEILDFMIFELVALSLINKSLIYNIFDKKINWFSSILINRLCVLRCFEFDWSLESGQSMAGICEHATHLEQNSLSYHKYEQRSTYNPERFNGAHHKFIKWENDSISPEKVKISRNKRLQISTNHWLELKKKWIVNKKLGLQFWADVQWSSVRI